MHIISTILDAFIRKLIECGADQSLTPNSMEYNISIIKSKESNQ